jgi:DNA-binding transcriptional LysR family regulator
MLDWNDLRFVLAVARGGSLSAAARELGVHQTTVGRRIDALEQSLAVPLFLRSPTGLVPAPEGVRLLRSIEDLAESLSSLEQTLRREQRGRAGIVRVALTEHAARVFARLLVMKLRRAHPQIVVDLLPANVVADLARGEADIALRLVKPDAPDLVARRLGAVRYGLYAARSYVERRGAPKGDSFSGPGVLIPARELARGPEALWMAENASQGSVALYASSHITIATAAEQGLGLAVLPTNLAYFHDGLELVRPLPDIAERPLWLVMHKDARKHARVRAVATVLASEFSALLART